MELFDAYFRRADLNGDGRINGAEALLSFEDPICPNMFWLRFISFLVLF